MSDLISRQAAIDALWKALYKYEDETEKKLGGDWMLPRTFVQNMNDIDRKTILDQPSVEPERDVPVRPIETTDKAWGIPSKQAVCPKCDYYLGHVAFLGDYKGKRITYCETCGQAIDWEGWDFDD